MTAKGPAHGTAKAPAQGTAEGPATGTDGALRSWTRRDARSRCGSVATRPRPGRSPPPSGNTSRGSRRPDSARSTGSTRGRDVGFNAMQPGRLKRGDLIFSVVAVAVIAALTLWAVP